MVDRILSSDNDYSSITSRLYSKINYLQQENQQLQDTIKELQQIIKLNKDLFKLAQSENSDLIIQQFNSKMDELQQNLVKAKGERNTAQNKVFQIILIIQLFLQEQINEETQTFLKEIIKELEDKIADLRRVIQEKELSIQDIQKNKIIQEDDQNIFQLKEILSPNEQNLKLFEELDQTRQFLNKISIESQNLQQEVNDLKNQNQKYREQLHKVKIALSTPITTHQFRSFLQQDLLDKSASNIDLNNEIYSNPMLNNDETQVQQAILQQYGYTQPTESQLKYLTTNERYQLKSNLFSKRAIFNEKLQKQEALLKAFKAMYYQQKVKSEQTEKIISEIQRQLEDSYYINETLIQSIKIKEDKNLKLREDLNYYTKQYRSIFNILQKKKEFSKDIDISPSNFRFNKFQGFNIDIITPSYRNLKDQKNFDRGIKKVQDKQEIKQIQEQQEEQEKQNDQQEEQQNPSQEDININVSVLEQEENRDVKDKFKKLRIQVDEDEQGKKQQYQQAKTTKNVKNDKNENIQNFFVQLDFKETKKFLLNQAKELYLSYNIRMKKLYQQQQNKFLRKRKIWLSRSNSDPIDYINHQIERGNQNEQILQLDVSVIDKKKEQQRITEEELSFISNDEMLDNI